MEHITEDKLLEYALEIIGDLEELTEIKAHVETCPECQKLLQTIHKDIDIISGIRGQIQLTKSPFAVKKRSFAYTLLKAAALLLLGFIIGLGVSDRSQTRSINILPSYLKLVPPADSLISFAASDATEIGEEYYRQYIE